MKPITYITGFLAMLTTAAVAIPWGALEIPAMLEKAHSEGRRCLCVCSVSAPGTLRPLEYARSLIPLPRLAPEASAAACSGDGRTMCVIVPSPQKNPKKCLHEVVQQKDENAQTFESRPYMHRVPGRIFKEIELQFVGKGVEHGDLMDAGYISQQLFRRPRTHLSSQRKEEYSFS